MYQQFAQVVYGRNLPTLFSSQNPNRITNSPKTERNSVAQHLLQPPLPQDTWETPSGRMHGGNASRGTFPQKAGKTIKHFLTKHVRSKLLITIGFSLHTWNLTPTPLSCTHILPRLPLENSFSFSLDLFLLSSKSIS